MLVGSCTTNQQGWCRVVSSSSSDSERSRRSQMVGVVVGLQGDVLYIPDIGWMGRQVRGLCDASHSLHFY